MTTSAITVTVAFSPRAGQIDAVQLSLPAGSTLAEALAASGVFERHPEARSLPAGIWGRQESPGTVLRMDDRVELYRPLLCDPKEARRLRYRQKAEKLKGQAAASVSGSRKR